MMGEITGMSGDESNAGAVPVRVIDYDIGVLGRREPGEVFPLGGDILGLIPFFFTASFHTSLQAFFEGDVQVDRVIEIR
jgi:hypothetical protein